MERRRVIIDTDAKNEADDQFAIVHALLTPMFDLRGLVPAHFGTRRTEDSLAESRAEVDLLIDLTGRTGDVRVADGAAAAISDEQTAADSPGAQLIIEESRSATDQDRLYVAFLGPLTEMASAILLDPEIVHRPVTVIWIGGADYGGLEEPGGIEFNLSNDIAAANVVLDSGITLWQVPNSVYSQVSVSYTELEHRIGDAGALGRYLIDQLIEFNRTHHGGPIESRSLGDSPAVGLLLYPASGNFRVHPSPRYGSDGRRGEGAGHPIRVCESVDTRFLLEDMFAKIISHARRVA